MNILFTLLQIFLAANVLGGHFLLAAYQNADGKAACCLGFVLMSLLSLIFALFRRKRRVFCLWMAAGALFGMAGDLLLSGVLSMGTICFALGHLCYLIAFCTLRPKPKKVLFFGGILIVSALCLIFFHPDFFFPDTATQFAVASYALIISTMTATALAACRRRVTDIVLCVGALLFFLSDLLLTLNWFMAGVYLTNSVTLFIYFLAQVTLAAGSFLATLEKA